MAVDCGGNVMVAGYSYDKGGLYADYTTLKYICVPSPVLTGVPLAGAAFQLQVDHLLRPGGLVIEASSNLADWAPVFTNTAPAELLFYTDPDVGVSPARYYRAFQFP
jgi:hypothetical protein